MVTRRSQKVRYAVIGLGHIAQVAVLPAFAHARRNSVLHAIVSGDAEKREEVGDKYGVPVRAGYEQYEEVLRDVDAVYIATPNSEHAAHAIRAAHAGVHVLCEKPLAVTDEECRRMIGACRESNVRLMTAYRLHFDPLVLEVLERIRNGDIGEPRFFSSSFSMRAKPGNIRTKPELGGGTLYDIGIYCIDAARMFLDGEPYEVFASSIDGARAEMPGIDETTAAILRFDKDRVASFVTSFNAADTSALRVAGTKGDIHMQPAYEYAEGLAYTLTVDGKTTKHRGRKRDQFAAELLYFSKCIQDDVEPEPSGEEGAQEVRIIQALYESARRGTPVSLPPFTSERRPTADQAINQPPVRKPETVNVETPHE